MNQTQRAERFKSLHSRHGAFLIPNPWDAGSARLLAGLGFEALATTSAGFAHSVGRLDGGVALDQVLDHCRTICAATDLPVSADLENGFARDPAGAANTIRLAAQTGLAGGSIEDYTGDPAHPIYDFDLAVERVQAAAEAAQSLDCPFMLTARAENLLRGKMDLDDTIRRLQAFEKAGADVLYAPALASLEQIRQVTAAVGKPVNVLGPFLKNATVAEMADAGAKRISVGGALARVAITALVRAATEMREQGSFRWAAELISGADVARLFDAAQIA